MSKFLIRQANAFRKVLSIVKRRPGAFLVNLVSFALVFALPFAGYLLFHNLSRLSAQIDYEPAISVYLSPTVTATQLSDAGVLIRRLPGVKDINIVKKETVLSQMKADADMKQALSFLADNPFPDTIVVRPKSTKTAALMSLKAELTKIKMVDRVDIDDVWAKRLNAAIDLGQALLIGILVLLGAVVVAMTTLIGRLEVLRDADENSLASLLGGVPSAIRRPYVYYGLALGIVGALLGVLAVFGGFWAVTLDAEALAKAYDSGFTSTFVPTLHLIGFVLAGGLLGAMGGWLASRAFRLK